MNRLYCSQIEQPVSLDESQSNTSTSTSTTTTTTQPTQSVAIDDRIDEEDAERITPKRRNKA